MIDSPATISAAQDFVSGDCPVTARRIVRPVRDFLAGLAMFTVLVLAVTFAPANTAERSPRLFAASAEAATQAPKLIRGWGDTGPAAAGLIYRSTDQREALVILGTAFAALVAFNLAFLRHLRHAYAARS